MTALRARNRLRDAKSYCPKCQSASRRGHIIYSPWRFTTKSYWRKCQPQHYSEAEVIVGIESRGFIFASVLAFYLNKPLHLIRKSGKLPPENLVSHTSRSEYAEVVLETAKGSGRAVIVDDVLATGGTLLASQKLLAEAGFSYTGSIFFINLRYLNSEPPGTCQALIHYDEN